MSRFAKATRLNLEAQLHQLIEVQQMQQHLVATQLGVSTDWVQRACTRLGLSTQRTGPRSGEAHPNWTGGVRVDADGYRLIYCPDHPYARQTKCVLEHRLVMERTLGRFLLPSEVVHHKDGNKQNNEPPNLELFQSNSDHLKAELTGRAPQWTEDGKKRIEAGIRKAAAIHRIIKSDDDLRILSTDHQT